MQLNCSFYIFVAKVIQQTRNAFIFTVLLLKTPDVVPVKNQLVG